MEELWRRHQRGRVASSLLGKEIYTSKITARSQAYKAIHDLGIHASWEFAQHVLSLPEKVAEMHNADNATLEQILGI